MPSSVKSGWETLLDGIPFCFCSCWWGRRNKDSTRSYEYHSTWISHRQFIRL